LIFPVLAPGSTVRDPFIISPGPVPLAMFGALTFCF
jgi:hypothetical protein